ncbi:MAG TPA: DUF2793 domain-containing protein [Allosphingosinicella sp.]|nr:DUF2793 domain-containing protein [Allosphingosinicella sp.]
MTELSDRFALPFILPGQAQKEMFHNEALARIDAALHPAVEEGPRTDPPGTPEAGQCWIVAPGGTGAWAGEDHAIACRTASGWRFVAPAAGMLAWNKAAGFWVHWNGSAWSDGNLPAAALVVGGQQVVGSRLETIASPSGGTIIDAEARLALDAVIATLKSHGLIES